MTTTAERYHARENRRIRFLRVLQWAILLTLLGALISLGASP